MTSAMKRKRGSVEVMEPPKRAKSVEESEKYINGNSLSQNAVTGWDAAFSSTVKPKELVQTNGVNGDNPEGGKDDSPEPTDFEAFAEMERKAEKKRNRVLAKADNRVLKSFAKQPPPQWKISESIGGRMLNVDPVFTVDEKFILLANRTTVHVYSTSTSLLTRSITLQIDWKVRPKARIITYCLSPTDPNFVWVACSDGAIYRIDWTTGAGIDQYWSISSTGCIHMTAASMESAGRRRDVVFTTEMKKDGGWRITANELAPPGSSIQTVARTIYTSTHQVHYLKTASEGGVLVAASGNRVVLGVLRNTEYDTIDKIRYEFRVFQSADFISSIDIKVSARPITEKSKKSKKRLPIVDVVVGDVRGTIFIHDDLWTNLVGEVGAPTVNILPRKLHWHRQGVHAVKYSSDGNYVISGGTETVLVQWQLDTGKFQFLPHMGSTIQNVVVSPTGASYGVQLADNSTMVLSVVDLLPTANIAGLQANVLTAEDSIDSSVWRVTGEVLDPVLMQRTPAAISPADPSRLILGVGGLQEVSHSQPLSASAPFLQTYDLASGRNISRQALTRTNLTSVVATPDAYRVSEPRVIHMKLSYDGKWLATVDEWMPPKKDVKFFSQKDVDLDVERLNRREVFLKFWQWSEEEQTWELVSRINNPHAFEDEAGAPRILDLAVDPSSLRFSTIGEDGFVRTWTTKSRKRDGIIVRSSKGIALRNWHCQHATSTGKTELVNPSDKPHAPILNGSAAFSEDGSLLAAASGIDGILHLIDPETGTIRSTRTLMFTGAVLSIAFLDQNLIVLSDKLLVHDLVSDVTRYSIALSTPFTSLSTSQKCEMVHLATDVKSHTFAIILPTRRKRGGEGLISYLSELAIFNPDNRVPVLQERFSTVVTALIQNTDSEGYLALDSLAEIHTVVKKGTQTLTTLARSEAALGIDKINDKPVARIRVEDDGEEEALLTSIDEKDVDADADDDETPVVTQQQLSEIFDIGPSFAMPPLEEMFYQVAGLFSSLPLAQSV